MVKLLLLFGYNAQELILIPSSGMNVLGMYRIYKHVVSGVMSQMAVITILS